MAILKNKQAPAALNMAKYGEHLRSNQPRDTNGPRSGKDYILQLSSDEIDGKVKRRCPRSSIGRKVAF